MRGLKGADRDQLTKLQCLVKTVVLHAVEAFVSNDMTKCLVSLGEAIDAKQELDAKMFTLVGDNACILQLLDVPEASNVVKEIKSFASFIPSKLVENINATFKGDAKPDDSQSCLVEWKKHIKSITGAVKGTKNFQVSIFQEMQTCLAKASERVHAALQTCVNTQAADAAKRCTKMIEETFSTDGFTLEVNDERLKLFGSHCEEACRLSSVLGGTGQILRRGLSIMEAAMTCKSAFATANPDEQASDVVLHGIKLLRPLMHTNETDLVRNDLSASFVAMGYKDALGERLAETIVGSLKELWSQAVALLKSIADSVEKTYIEERKKMHSKLSIPDEVLKLANVSEIGSLAAQQQHKPAFPLEFTEAVGESCHLLEEAENTIKHIAKKIGCSAQEVYDTTKVQRLRRECLTWLSLGC